MSKTPETDKVEEQFGAHNASAFATLARTLETQRDEAREMCLDVSRLRDEMENERDEARAEGERLHDIIKERSQFAEFHVRKAAEAEAEVERLRKAITDVLPGMKCQQPPKPGAWNWPWAVETLEDALQPEKSEDELPVPLVNRCPSKFPHPGHDYCPGIPFSTSKGGQPL